jgi:hypothetical protein
MTGSLGHVNEERSTLRAHYPIGSVRDAIVALRDLSVMIEDDTTELVEGKYSDLESLLAALYKIAGIYAFMGETLEYLINKKED